ncbi:MAG: apolipoprotein N-acyltransferase, partial [Pseudomonadota bacterium]
DGNVLLGIAYQQRSTSTETVVSLVILFSLWAKATTSKQAAVIGFAWGLGLFLAGVSWLYVSLHVYGNMPALLAAMAIFIFCSYLALYPALAGWLQARFCVSPLIKLLLLLPAIFAGTEYLRGWVVSGFPWLILGYSQTPSTMTIAPLAGYAPLVGVFGITWLLALTAGAIVSASAKLSGFTMPPIQRRWLGTAGIFVWLAGIVGSTVEWSTPSGNALPVSLTQGNIEQQLKWREDQRTAAIENYLDLAEKSRGKLIVLPETALPMMLDDVPNHVMALLNKQALANDGNVLLGIAYQQRSTSTESVHDYYNGAVSLGVAPSQRYAKQHLVAFGEFVPPLFAWVYRWLTIPLSDFTPGTETQAPMRLSGHLLGVNICYEDAFGAEIARPLPDAELLVNISNMAWYGRSLAADQHAQFSQMRALETARWMLRSTNTGVTAAIDEKGRIVKALPQFTRGVLEVDAVPRQGTTPYSRWRDGPVLWLLAGVLLFSFYKHRQAGKKAAR